MQKKLHFQEKHKKRPRADTLLFIAPCASMIINSLIVLFLFCLPSMVQLMPSHCPAGLLSMPCHSRIPPILIYTIYSIYGVILANPRFLCLNYVQTQKAVNRFYWITAYGLE